MVLSYVEASENQSKRVQLASAL